MQFLNPLIISFIIAFIVIFTLFFIWPWLFGAPFEPTSNKKMKKMIKLAKLKKTDKVVDLGSGDGRLVIEMAKHGVKESHGYEINPFLVLLSKLKIKRQGLSKKAFIHWGNFWNKDLGKFDVIILFQFSTIMKRLKKKLKKELKKNSRIVSYHWKFPNWKPIKRLENIYLYKINN